MSGTSNPCGGCALSPGAAAHCEPDNNIRAQLCVLGAIPFYCHAGFDWQEPDAHKITKEDVRARGIGVCQGWRREVAALAKTGYYRDRGPLKREFAIIGVVNLEAYLKAAAGSVEKKDACDILAAILKQLNAMRGFRPADDDS